MTAGGVDPIASPITFRQGERVAYSVTFKRGGVPIDITDWTFQSDLRKVPSGQLITSWTPTVASPATGVVVFSLERSETLDIPPTPPDVSWGTDGWAFEPDGTPHAIARRAVIVSATYTPL
jgi:hypothetical protein